MGLVKKMTFVTLVSCYFLIFMGGLVRATGSGLGCPDWPRCFGLLIPPTDLSELPLNYQETFAVSGKKVAPFDPLKTWIEYLNRLWGLVVGMEMVFLVLFSFKARKEKRALFPMALLTFLLTGLQGGLGGMVVLEGLRPWLVSLHMAMALVILLSLHLLLQRASDQVFPSVNKVEASFLLKLGGVLFAVSLAQVALGVSVRQGVDVLSQGDLALLGQNWREGLGLRFIVHRLWALSVVAISALWFFHILKSKERRLIASAKIMLGGLLMGLLSGTLLYALDFPLLAPPLHLLSASFFIGMLFFNPS